MSRLNWDRDGADWPNREASRFVRAGGLDWHVQRMAPTDDAPGDDVPGDDAPRMLLLHGTGASTHSWNMLLPMLAEHYDMVAVDLPGHGFTGNRSSGFLSLPWMARVTGDLLDTLDFRPDQIVGHSAGAAVGARMILDGRASPDGLIALSGALLPFPGMAQKLFPAIAKMMFLNPFVPKIMSWHASSGTGAVEKTIAGTGSTLDARQMALYDRLFRSSGHVEAALAMMANWDLPGLEADLPKLDLPLTLIAPEGDKFVSPDVARRVAKLVPSATIVPVPALGHLAHEEDAALIAGIVRHAVRPGRPAASV